MTHAGTSKSVLRADHGQGNPVIGRSAGHHDFWSARTRVDVARGQTLTRVSALSEHIRSQSTWNTDCRVRERVVPEPWSAFRKEGSCSNQSVERLLDQKSRHSSFGRQVPT